MSVFNLVMSFCGGMIGAIFGPISTFIFVGCTGLLGIISALCDGKFDWIGLVSLGRVFAPNIAFAGGVAAAAYAGKKGYLKTGKDIVTPLVSLKKPSVLLVGGIFGALGYVLNFIIGSTIPGKIDSLALTLTVLAIVGKVTFGEFSIKGIIGTVPEEIKKVGGRFSVRSSGTWIPYQNTALEKTLLGVAIGGASAYLTYVMLQNPATSKVAVFIGFFLSAASLLWLITGHDIPITHHITLCAAYGVIASNGNLMWGIAGAVIGSFAGDFFAKAFLVYGNAHVDPPSLAIAFTSLLLLTIFPMVGFYNTGYLVPIIIIGLALVNIFIEEVVIAKREKVSKEVIEN